jgi:hypothetical protein
MTDRIDHFLATRGLAPRPATIAEPVPPAKPEAFICEEDVRQAVKNGQRLLIGERTIVTPAARDAGEAAGVFLHEGWRS